MSGMRRFAARGVLACLTAGAVLATSVTPATARDGRYGGYYRGGYGYGYGYGYPYRYRPYRRDRLDAGDVIGIAALVGAVAVIASAASKSKKAERYPESRDSSRDYPRDRDDYDRGDDYSASGEDEAVNACATAARDEAERNGGYAEILEVERPSSRGGDNWHVQGTLEQRRNYQDKRGMQKNFSCTVENGRIARVQVRDYVA
ncbi:MAG: hypothetical protein AB7U35_03855 [Sphingobium sp.]